MTVSFVAIQLLTQAKNYIAALNLQRHLVACVRTAWSIKHKLLQVMGECKADRILAGWNDIDDAYLIGELAVPPGRAFEAKLPFVVAVETNEPGHQFFIKLSSTPFIKTELNNWSEASLNPDSSVVSVGLGGFLGITVTLMCHHRVFVESGRSAVQHPVFRWVNIIVRNLNTAIANTYHVLDFAKHAVNRHLVEVNTSSIDVPISRGSSDAS